MRTHFCGKISFATDRDKLVTVCGWVNAHRDHGGVIFIDLRDNSGVVQVVIDPADDNEDSRKLFAVAESVRNEYVLRVQGTLQRRRPGTENPELDTGEVEILASSIEILNAAVPPPFLPGDTASEETRLRHRVLDLRGATMQKNLRLRHIVASAARRRLEADNFLEVETPLLTRATPEGARDFLVPSRLQGGLFYALPQSPQLFKQLLMAAGVEKYYQIARCFRDEDLRADRQPEFSQIDLEMAFAEEREVMAAAEDLVRAVFSAAGAELPAPFARMPWREAMDRFGSDKPDLRNPLELKNIAEIMKQEEFKVFRDPARADDGLVVVLRLPGGGDLTRGEIDLLTEFVIARGARGLAYIKVLEQGKGAAGLQSPIVKFLSEKALTEVMSAAAADDGDILFFGAGDEETVRVSMAALRDKLAQMRGLSSGGWRPLWVTNFPMFEYDRERGAWAARHHPFTAVRRGDEEKIADSPAGVESRAYDLTLNGVELGGGSVRIHQASVQLAVLAALGLDEQTARRQFGFLLSALESGAPPHGGIAFGLDRMAAMLAGCNSIRDVMAFPKTQRGQCPLTGAPAAVAAAQLKELGLVGRAGG